MMRLRLLVIYGSILVLTIVFFVSASRKLLEAFSFASAILEYRIVGSKGAFLASAVLPWVEIGVALGLLFLRWRAGALYLALLLLAGFIVAQLSVLARGITASCGCFGGATQEVVGVWTIARTALLLLMAATGVFLKAPILSADRVVGVMGYPTKIPLIIICTIWSLQVFAFPSADDRNAADYYERSADLLNVLTPIERQRLSAFIQDPSSSSREDVIAILERADPSIRLAVAGSSIRNADFSHRRDPALMWAAPHIGEIRTVTDVLTARALISSVAGDQNRFVQDVRAMLRITAHLAPDGNVVASMRANGIAQRCAEMIEKVQASGSISPASALSLVAQIDATERSLSGNLARAVTEQGQGLLDCAELVRASEEGLNELRSISQPEIAALADMDEQAFIGATEAQRQFAAQLEAAEQDGNLETMLALAKAAQDGQFGEIAKAQLSLSLTAKPIQQVIVDARSVADKLRQLREDLEEIARNEMSGDDVRESNAAHWYLLGADLLRQKHANALTGALDTDENEKVLTDALAKVKRGALCDWCDFDAIDSQRDLILPSDLPYLYEIARAILDTTSPSNWQSRRDDLWAIGRLCLHLGTDGRIGSALLAQHLAERLLKDWTEPLMKEVVANVESDLFGYREAMDEITNGVRTEWWLLINVAPTSQDQVDAFERLLADWHEQERLAILMQMRLRDADAEDIVSFFDASVSLSEIVRTEDLQQLLARTEILQLLKSPETAGAELAEFDAPDVFCLEIASAQRRRIFEGLWDFLATEDAWRMSQQIDD